MQPSSSCRDRLPCVSPYLLRSGSGIISMFFGSSFLAALRDNTARRELSGYHRKNITLRGYMLIVTSLLEEAHLRRVHGEQSPNTYIYFWCRSPRTLRSRPQRTISLSCRTSKFFFFLFLPYRCYAATEDFLFCFLHFFILYS